MRKLIRITLMIALVLSICTTTVQATEQEVYQDITLSFVIDGQIYCYANDTKQFEDWNYTVDMFDFWLDDGIYIIKWTGNVLADEQAILLVYDVANRVYYK